MIIFAVFNRFDKPNEEAAHDHGATAWQVLRQVVPPIIAPSLIGVGLFGFTLSYDEFARTLLTGGSHNALPQAFTGLPGAAFVWHGASGPFRCPLQAQTFR